MEISNTDPNYISLICCCACDFFFLDTADLLTYMIINSNTYSFKLLWQQFSLTDPRIKGEKKFPYFIFWGDFLGDYAFGLNRFISVFSISIESFTFKYTYLCFACWNFAMLCFWVLSLVLFTVEENYICHLFNEENPKFVLYLNSKIVQRYALYWNATGLLQDKLDTYLLALLRGSLLCL